MTPTRFICASLLALAVTAAGHSQATIRLSDKVLQSVTMDAAAKSDVQAFIARAMEYLKSADPSQVRSGRDMISQPMTKGGANNSFRTLFASMILPSLKQVVADGSTFQASNALEAIKSLQSPDSMSYLAEQASTPRQPNATLRLIAASGIALLRTPIDLTTAQADAILKSIGANIATEKDWMVLAYGLQALQSFSTSPRVPKASQNTAQTLLVGALHSLATRLRSDSVDAGMIRAINRCLALNLRDQIPNMSHADAAAATALIEPTLKILKAMAINPPSPEYSEAYAQAGKLADKFLTTLGTRTPSKGTPQKPSGGGSASGQN
ncbi:MAG: hypothetical protein EXS15_07685 [Phycisphaerales bacterium]|nr:hypothetical protein [Phycisphaerales bacterium]